MLSTNLKCFDIFCGPFKHEIPGFAKVPPVGGFSTKHLLIIPFNFGGMGHFGKPKLLS